MFGIKWKITLLFGRKWSAGGRGNGPSILCLFHRCRYDIVYLSMNTINGTYDLRFRYLKRTTVCLLTLEQLLGISPREK